jgi:hypothetical protein
MMNDIVTPMNSASSINDLCRSYGIDSSYYVYDKFNNSVTLHDPLFAFGGETDEHTLVKPCFGPPKGYPRALAKEEEGRKKSGDKWIGLRDLNRVTFEFEDPLMLTLAYHALITKYTVSGLKNKFEWVHTTSYKQPPDIHMNLDIGGGWLVEVQLMFSSVLTVKKELHKFYDIVRASSPQTTLAPLFKEYATNEDRQREENKKLRSIIESVKNADALNQRLENVNLQTNDEKDKKIETLSA